MKKVVCLFLILGVLGCKHNRRSGIESQTREPDNNTQNTTRIDELGSKDKKQGDGLSDLYLVADDSLITQILSDPTAKIDENPVQEEGLASVLLFPSKNHPAYAKGENGLLVVQISKESLGGLEGGLGLANGSGIFRSMDEVDLPGRSGDADLPKKNGAGTPLEAPAGRTKDMESKIPEDSMLKADAEKPRILLGKFVANKTFGTKKARTDGSFSKEELDKTYEELEKKKVFNLKEGFNLTPIVKDSTFFMKKDDNYYTFYTKKPITDNQSFKDRKVILYFGGSGMPSNSSSSKVQQSILPTIPVDDFISFNYRGFGERVDETPKISQQTIEEDAEKAYNDLIKLGYQPENITLYGYSMGAHAASHVLSKHPDSGIGGLILDRPMMSLKDGIRGDLGFAPPIIGYYAEKTLGGAMNEAKVQVQTSTKQILILDAKDKMSSGIKSAKKTEKVTVITSDKPQDHIDPNGQTSPFIDEHIAGIIAWFNAQKSQSQISR